MVCNVNDDGAVVVVVALLAWPLLLPRASTALSSSKSSMLWTSKHDAVLGSQCGRSYLQRVRLVV